MVHTFKDKPAAADILAISQGDIQGNFEYLQGALSGAGGTTKDHQLVFGHTDGDTAEGRHNSVGFIDHNSQAFPTDGLDSFLYSYSGNMRWRNSSVGEVNMTNANAGVPIVADPGMSWLFGGLMIQWGSITTTGPGANPFTYAGLGLVNFSGTFNPIVIITPKFSTAIVTAVGITLSSSTGFTLTQTGIAGAEPYYFVAIGAK